jgi:hypothetical protein
MGIVVNRRTAAFCVVLCIQVACAHANRNAATQSVCQQVDLHPIPLAREILAEPGSLIVLAAVGDSEQAIHGSLLNARLVDARGRTTQYKFDSAFTAAGVPPGKTTLRVQAIGYKIRTDTLDLAPSHGDRIKIRLVPVGGLDGC